MEIGAISRSLGVPAPTIRRWTREFQAGLRPAACGGDGRPRTFTPRDVRVLRRAKELLADGLTYEQVRQHLDQEGLLQAAGPDEVGDRPESEAEREAAERYVRTIFERFSEPDRAEHAAMVEKIRLLEENLARLGARLDQVERMLATTQADDSLDSQSRGDSSRDSARRPWPFR